MLSLDKRSAGGVRGVGKKEMRYVGEIVKLYCRHDLGDSLWLS